LKKLEKLLQKASLMHVLSNWHGKYNYNPTEKLQLYLVHGMFCNSGVFSKMERTLDDILPSKSINLTGHGARRDEINSGMPISFYTYVHDVLLSARNGPCIFVGHSLGALACLVAKTATFNPASKNIQGIITISSSGPRGIYLPGNVILKMLTTRAYLSALFLSITAPMLCKRFNLRKDHAEKFMLNETPYEHRQHMLQNLESESALVLRQLAFGIPLTERVPNVHMFKLREDKIATPAMQDAISGLIDAPPPEMVNGVDHLSLDNPMLINCVRHKVVELIEDYESAQQHKAA
jgi:pimeloyl-ACP methyl ester carboxylesterase